jgi:ATP-dependent Lon protease
MPKRKKDEKFIINKLANTYAKTSSNTSIYKSLIENVNIDEITYFNGMPYDAQMKIIDDLTLLKIMSEINTPYRIQLLNKNISLKFKIVALKKINVFEKMESSDGEYHKLKKWIEDFLSLPFEISRKIPVSIDDGLEKCQAYMEECRKILNDSVYGLNDAKMQIMQFVGQLISNPSSIGNAIGLKGPMGTGKTTLIKNGLSKILGREFAFVTLGGASDGHFLVGHSYTYEGSNYGKISDILIQCKSDNPIIFFDELDKVSDSHGGNEIVGILTHLIDSTQNNEFHDKYFSEIDINVSKCLFVFSFNDETLVNNILKDRMYVIETNGYNNKDKIEICKNFILPSVTKEMNLENIIMSDTIIEYIIENYTKPEKGVRNLKRNIETIVSKINLFRLLKPNTCVFDHIPIHISFPLIINCDLVDKLLPKLEKPSTIYLNMYL